MFKWLKQKENVEPPQLRKHNKKNVKWPSVDEMRRMASHEAMSHLGLLKAEAEATIYALLTGELDNHPRTLCAAFRKEGEQLSAYEKRSLGIRSNAFLSRQAFGQLTDKGLKNPLAAHETVLLRATFIMSRYKAVLNAPTIEADAFDGMYKYDVINMDCPAYAALEGVIVNEKDVFVLPPPNCVCETANYTIGPQVDFLRGW